MESMNEDINYIIQKAGLTGKINVSLYENSSQNANNVKSQEEKHFWSQVSDALAVKVCHAYKLDFDMFEYSPIEYFQSLNLISKANAVKKLNK